MHKLSIVIPTLMQCDVALKELLDTLKPIIKQHEVVIIFQGSNLETFSRFCDSYANVDGFVFIKSEKTGISVARNCGIQASKNEWIVLLDDDVIVKNDFIERLELDIDSDDMFYYGNVYIDGSLKRYVNLYVAGRSLDYFSYNRVCSVALVFSKKLIEKIEAFDETLGAGTYFGSCEESDLILRALKNGVEVKYLAGHNVWHPAPSFPLAKIFRYGVGLGGMYKKQFNDAPIALKVKFVGDLLARIVMLVTFAPKRYVFLYGFIVGVWKY